MASRVYTPLLPPLCGALRAPHTGDLSPPSPPAPHRTSLTVFTCVPIHLVHRARLDAVRDTPRHPPATPAALHLTRTHGARRSFLVLAILHSPARLNALPLPLRRRLAAGLVAAGESQLSLALFDDGSVPVEPPPKSVLHGVLAELKRERS